MKHLELRRIRISDGYASYFLDQIDHFMLAQFEADVKAAFKAFWSNNSPSHKSSEAKMFEDKIDVQALSKTIDSSKWDRASAIDPVNIIATYDIDGEELNDKSGLDLQEFTYFLIFENIKSGTKSKCTNCLEKTKEVINDFFKYLDCNKDGLLSAENIFNGMSNMKGLPYPNTTTTMVNDFVLNTMEHKSASLDIFDFSYGLLVGMFERVIDSDALSEINLNSMKVVRRKNLKDGFGPLRK